METAQAETGGQCLLQMEIPQAQGLPIRLSDHCVRKYRDRIRQSDRIRSGALEPTRAALCYRLHEAATWTEKPDWVKSSPRRCQGYLSFIDQHISFVIPLIRESGGTGLVAKTIYVRNPNLEVRDKKDKRRLKPNRLDQLAELTG